MYSDMNDISRYLRKPATRADFTQESTEVYFLANFRKPPLSSANVLNIDIRLLDLRPPKNKSIFKMSHSWRSCVHRTLKITINYFVVVKSSRAGENIDQYTSDKCPSYFSLDCRFLATDTFRSFGSF